MLGVLSEIWKDACILKEKMRVIIDYKCLSFPESIRLTGASKWLFRRVLKKVYSNVFSDMGLGAYYVVEASKPSNAG